MVQSDIMQSICANRISSPCVVTLSWQVVDSKMGSKLSKLGQTALVFGY